MPRESDEAGYSVEVELMQLNFNIFYSFVHDGNGVSNVIGPLIELLLIANHIPGNMLKRI